MRFIMITLLLISFIFAQTGKNGRIFDQGERMTTPSSNAPEGTAALQSWLGDWDVTQTIHIDDTTQKVFEGRAHISLFNRGHGYMERYTSKDYYNSGKTYGTITLITRAGNSGIWMMGLADAYREQCSVFNGNLQNGRLVFRHSERPRGGQQLVHFEASWVSLSENAKRYMLKQSNDGENWKTVVVKEYLRSDTPIAMPDSTAGYGTPAADVPEEARQFDFIVGEWTALNDMFLPQAGRRVQWQANATAVYVLDGRAIMEHNWFNTDPNFPEAATTIIRLYNRAMRRWECIYTTNRFNGQLYFGGVKEGEQIVLTLFDLGSAGPYPYFIFHDMQENSYKWHSLNTSDRGESTTQNWKIEFTRKP